MQNALKCAVIPNLVLNVDGAREYMVEFPLSAVIVAEAETGKSLKTLTDWFGLQPKDVAAVLKAGLSRHHPEVTEAEIKAICDRLNPEALDEVLYALCNLAFPRSMERLEQRRVKALAEKLSPNAPSADAS